jgi:hypothetical protein
MIIVSTPVRELVDRSYDINFTAFRPQGTPNMPDDAKDLYQKAYGKSH